MLTEIITGGVDYDSGPYTVTFPAGVTSVSFNVTIFDDNMLENHEDFRLSISSRRLPAGVCAGKPSKVVISDS